MSGGKGRHKKPRNSLPLFHLEESKPEGLALFHTLCLSSCFFRVAFLSIIEKREMFKFTPWSFLSFSISHYSNIPHRVERMTNKRMKCDRERRNIPSSLSCFYVFWTKMNSFLILALNRPQLNIATHFYTNTHTHSDQPALDAVLTWMVTTRIWRRLWTGWLDGFLALTIPSETRQEESFDHKKENGKSLTTSAPKNTNCVTYFCDFAES